MAEDDELSPDELIEQMAQRLAMKMLGQYAKTLRPVLQVFDAAAAKLAFAEVAEEPERSQMISDVRQKLEDLSQHEQLRQIVALADREEPS